MKHIIILIIVFLSYCNVVFAQIENPKFISSIEGIKEYSLSNGLQILLIPDEGQSNMVTNIVYKVGSKHEGYGEKGMAHLLEHMLFKSTKKLGDIKKMLSDKGGNANGTTWYDRTNYYEIFPSTNENLKWSIEMEADRMVNATILQSDLDKEFSVVRNEFEIGENDPSGVLMERILSSAYLWHNYGNSTIGSKEDIERVKINKLKVFYEKYYQPDNATLIIAGKFDEKKALEYIAKNFSIIPKSNRILDKTYTIEPPQDGERFVELKRSGDVQYVAAVYHTVPFADKDFAALDALTEILQADPSGYLYKALIETQKASSVYCWQPNLRDASFIYFGLEAPKNKNLNEAKSLLLSALDNIGTTKYTEQDLKRGKAKLLKQIENSKNNTINYAIGLTEIIGAGDYKLQLLYRDNVENLSLDDINRVAAKYFKPNNRTFGTFIPSQNEERVKTTEFTDEQIASLTKNYKGKAIEEDLSTFEANIPNIKKNLSENTLANGLRYAFLKKPIKGKKVIATFNIPVGNEKNLEGKRNIASLMADMLKLGTKNLSKEQIQDQLDEMKSSISFNWRGQKLYVKINTYQEYLEKIMVLVKNCLTESIFPENELVKTKTENKTYYESQLNDPKSIVFTMSSKKASNYPTNHIFYKSLPKEDIENETLVTQKQIIEFFTQYLGGNNTYGTLVGDLDKNIIGKVVKNTFDGWNSKVSYEKIIPNLFNTKAYTERIQINDKENGAVSGKLNFKMNKLDTDYPAFMVANEMLGSGGFLTSRIPTRLREKEGISYGAGSHVNVPTDYDAASWGVYAFYNPTKIDKVDEALKDEITKALQKGFTPNELKTSIESWKNDRNIRLGNNNFLINLINHSMETKTSLDEFDNLEKKVIALKVDQVNSTIKKYISLDKLILIYAGDFTKK